MTIRRKHHLELCIQHSLQLSTRVRPAAPKKIEHYNTICGDSLKSSLADDVWRDAMKPK